MDFILFEWGQKTGMENRVNSPLEQKFESFWRWVS
uniref:Uncharacterized protein n=1 Tax=Moniliophthora roreri TaxID=221103 RepID=A0A0W0GAA4_MONRR